MLTHAFVCWRMLTYADVCWRMLTYADVFGKKAKARWMMYIRSTLTRSATLYADVCWRMLTYSAKRRGGWCASALRRHALQPRRAARACSPRLSRRTGNFFSYFFLKIHLASSCSSLLALYWYRSTILTHSRRTGTLRQGVSFYWYRSTILTHSRRTGTIRQGAALWPQAPQVCWRMLTYADVCWRMLTYADVCWRMLDMWPRTSIYTTRRCALTPSTAGMCIRMLTYADVCWRMLTYAGYVALY
jgi:hypothetical protein